jgi:hypothetical protein
MRNLVKRLKFAWKAFLGEPYKVDSNQFVFPERIVQLLNFHDKIIALDDVGRLYEMRQDYSGFMVIELIHENMLRF